MHHLRNLSAEFSSVTHADLENPHFCLGFDGSECSRNALDFLVKVYIHRDRAATVDAVHVHNDPQKLHLPPRQRSAGIKTFLSAYDTANGKQFSSHVLARDVMSTAGKQLVNFATAPHEGAGQADFVVVGYLGRKASRDDMLASNVSYALRYATSSVLVVKDSPDDTLAKTAAGAPLSYMVAMDGNRWSERALLDALLLSKPGDTIECVQVAPGGTEAATGENLQGMVDQITAKFGAEQVTVVQTVVSPSGATIAQALLDHLNSSQHDVLFVGTDAARLRSKKSVLGSVCVTVLLCAAVPVVVSRYDAAGPSNVAITTGEEDVSFRESLMASVDDVHKYRKKVVGSMSAFTPR